MPAWTNAWGNVATTAAGLRHWLGRIPALVLIGVALVLTSVALHIADPEPTARLRTSVFDAYMRLSPRQLDPSFPVRIVAIDEQSLAQVGQWPWPRSRLADIVGRLTDAGAKTVAFDIMLAEPDRMSAPELARVLAAEGAPPGVVAELSKLPSSDAALAGALGRTRSVVGVIGDSHGKREIGAPRASFAFAGADPRKSVHAFDYGISSLPQLAAAATGSGAVNWFPAQDQVVRRVPLLVGVAGRLYPSLALEILRVGLDETTVLVTTSRWSALPGLGQQAGIESVRVGQTVLPSDGRGELWLRFAPSDPRRTISAQHILAGSFDHADVAGRHIIIGATAAGLLDNRATPLAASVAGAEIHAQALEQMLSGDHLTRPSWIVGAEIIFIAACGLMVTWLVSRAAASAAAVIAVAAIGGIALLSWGAYARAGLLLDPVYPSLSVGLFYLGTSLASHMRSERDRASISRAFGHYVSPTLVAELAASRDRLKLGGETRQVTLLFADVRGFSQISENLDAEALIQFVNRLFTPLGETILEHRGTIDKFMGDAVMAFWNAPLADAEHAPHACRAALAMLADLERFNAVRAEEARSRGEAPVHVRLGIGINTGDCVVGNVGSPQRFDYSVLGDAVNVAARLEEETKRCGADIVIGETTALQVPHFALLKLGSMTIRGKARPEAMFALVGDEAVARSSEFRRLDQRHSRLQAALAAGDTERARVELAACLEATMPSAARIYDRVAEDIIPR